MIHQPLQMLEEEERRARVRLSAFRARLYRSDFASPMATQMRLRELERSWLSTAARLKAARSGQPSHDGAGEQHPHETDGERRS